MPKHTVRLETVESSINNIIKLLKIEKKNIKKKRTKFKERILERIV